jgi:hypothetical protein
VRKSLLLPGGEQKASEKHRLVAVCQEAACQEQPTNNKSNEQIVGTGGGGLSGATNK